jgi:hypothetical protein
MARVLDHGRRLPSFHSLLNEEKHGVEVSAHRLAVFGDFRISIACGGFASTCFSGPAIPISSRRARAGRCLAHTAFPSINATVQIHTPDQARATAVDQTP